MKSGIIQPPAFQRPSGKLFLGTQQNNLVHGDDTLVLLDTISANFKDGIEDVATHRITPGVAGWYSIVGQVEFESLSMVADARFGVNIRVSGVLANENWVHSSIANTVTGVCLLPCYYLTPADYVELHARSYAGVDTVDISSNELSTFLALQRVR